MTLSVQGPIDDILTAITKAAKENPAKGKNQNAAKKGSDTGVPVWVYFVVAYLVLK